MTGTSAFNMTIGEIVAADYRAAAVFQRRGIDFCCHGARTLERGCRDAGIDTAEVLREIEACINKNRFRVVLPAACQVLRLEYWVYAHELSVRTADVTPEHAYWNHACVLLWPVDHPHARARIAIRLPAGWDFASALPTIADRGGEIVLAADGLDHAVDSPCVAGALQRLELHALGVRHTVVLEGLALLLRQLL